MRDALAANFLKAYHAHSREWQASTGIGAFTKGWRRPLHFGIRYIEIKAEKIFNLLQFFPLVVPQYLFMLCRKWYMNDGGS